MAIQESFPMTDEQYRSYVVSSLATIQARLAVMYEIQTHLLAKAYGTSQEEQKQLLDKGFDEAIALAVEAARTGKAVI
jgi:hypothetical protein